MATLVVAIVAFAAVLGWIVGFAGSATTVCHWFWFCRSEPQHHFRLTNPTEVRLYFEYDKSTLSDKTFSQIEDIARQMRENPNYVAVIQPYADTEAELLDSQGAQREQEIRAIASRRADSVASELLRIGIPPDRLDTRSAKIAATNREPYARAVFVLFGNPAELDNGP